MIIDSILITSLVMVILLFFALITYIFMDKDKN